MIIPSPNIWYYPAVYEKENLGVDPDGVIEAAMREIHDWAGGTVLDIGCGSGFHLPWFAGSAERVIGVEPHQPLLELARRRTFTLSPQIKDKINIREGTAQSLPVASGTVDVVHARWAYFFGPGCEPGLAEIGRVLRKGGTAFVIDNDASRSTFGGWFREALPKYDPAAVERFWARQGWARRSLDMRWEHPTREDFEAVVRIEFTRELADRILASHSGNGVDYAVNLFWRSA